MSSAFSEKQVHDALCAMGGLESIVQDSPEIEKALDEADYTPPKIDPAEYPGPDFELWKFVKSRALQKIGRLHRTVRYGDFIGSKINLRTDDTKPMQLDLLGQHELGLFILELKVDKTAERNAFSELFAYSNYIAEMFALSGSKDITNVLVANLDNKITTQAYLYDLLIADRNVIVYRPEFPTASLDDLTLHLHIPDDEDFKHLTNRLLSHESMDCVVVSFDDMGGWFDSNEDGGDLNDPTIEHLSKLSTYAAQLMEAERLHGFCFVRKRWKEVQMGYGNSLIFCAINPFRIAGREQSNDILEQLDEKHHYAFFEVPEMGFDSRLFALAKRTIKDGLTHDYDCELESAVWSAMVVSMIEVVFTHNFAFRPTGIFREAYSNYLNMLYADENAGLCDEDISVLKVNELYSWFNAWQFMERCGFTEPDHKNGLEDESVG
ncbi:hypothetical protein [Bradyrhizobium sp. WSM2793]|uniref:hypothetical protein n=1 Tax=Bradyrhizobium sp. WSM2793 TaxID=1038866 RepID=UPI0018DF125F|nr:hypothetical protein [Bradyrhizobium sp. WSM2793]